MATNWLYGLNGLNQAGLTQDQQAYWDQQGVKQQNDLGYTWQPTYNKGYGGFQTQAEYDAWKATQPAAPPRVDWQAEAAAGRPVIGGVSATKDPYAGVPAPTNSLQMYANQQQPQVIAGTGGKPVPFGVGGSTSSGGGSSIYGQTGGMMPTASYTPPYYDPNSAPQAPAAPASMGLQGLGPAAAMGMQGIGIGSPAASAIAMGLQGLGPAAAIPGNTSGTLYGMGLQGLGMGLQPFQSSYLDNVSQSLWNQANRNWNDTINPSIQNQSVMAGNFGDRSEIARGVMMDRLNQSVFNAMAPQYAQSYDNWLNRGVQTGNAALGSDLGYGNLGLGYYGADTQRQLGMGALDVSRYNAQTNAAQAAAGAAGVQQYTNPWLAGIGALTSLYPFLYGKG